MTTKKQDLKTHFIDLIMKKNYDNDAKNKNIASRLKNQDLNRAFLQSCTIKELQKMANNEDEEDDGEILGDDIEDEQYFKDDF